MELRPQTPTDTEPSYPARRAGRLGLGGRLRRLAAAAGLALALGAGGCMGLGGDEPDDEDFELAGVMVEPYYFTCAEAEPSPLHTDPMTSSGYFDGRLCGDQTAWGQLDVPEPVTVTAEFSAGEGGAAAAFISPEGIEAFELRSDLPSTTFHLPAGSWTIAVTGMTPDDLGWFSLSFSPVER